MLQPFKLPPREDAFPREQFCATGGQTFIGEQHLAFCSFLTICFSTQVLNDLVPKKSTPESRKWFVQEILIKTLKKPEKLLLIKNIRSMAFSKLFVRNYTGKKSSVFPSSTFRVLWVFFSLLYWEPSFLLYCVSGLVTSFCIPAFYIYFTNLAGVWQILSCLAGFVLMMNGSASLCLQNMTVHVYTLSSHSIY